MKSARKPKCTANVNFHEDMRDNFCKKPYIMNVHGSSNVSTSDAMAFASKKALQDNRSTIPFMTFTGFLPHLNSKDIGFNLNN